MTQAVRRDMEMRYRFVLLLCSDERDSPAPVMLWTSGGRGEDMG